MKIKKLSIMALSMALALVMTGCEVVSVNRDKDMAQVVAEVGDRKITKQEIYEEVNTMLSSQGVDLFDDKMTSDMRDYVEENYLIPMLEAEVEDEIIKKKAAENNIELTEEEQKDAEENVKSYEDMVKATLGYDEEKPDEYEGNIDEDVNEYMKSNIGYTPDEYLELITTNTKSEKLKEEVTKEAQATDEEIKAKYDLDLKAQKDVFSTEGEVVLSPSPEATDGGEAPAATDGSDSATTETDPDSTYADLASNSGAGSAGSYVLYKPAGYKIVKHILLEFTEEDKAKIEAVDKKISELQEKVSPVEQTINEANTIITSAEEYIAELKGEAQPEESATPESPADEAVADPSASPESTEKPVSEMSDDEKQAAIAEQEKLITEKKAEVEDLTKGMAPDQAAVSDAEAEKETIRNEAKEHLQPTVDKIKQRYDAGESFDALIDEYNTDDGMKEGSGKHYGYLVDKTGSGFVNEFSEAALKLANVGDLSEPVMSTYGVHVIRLEMGDEAADIPYEKASLVVKDVLDEDAATKMWDELMEQWKKDMNVKIDNGKLKYII